MYRTNLGLAVHNDFGTDVRWKVFSVLAILHIVSLCFIKKYSYVHKERHPKIPPLAQRR